MTEPILWTNKLGQKRWQPVRSDGRRCRHGVVSGTYQWGTPRTGSMGTVALFRWRWRAKLIAWAADRQDAKRFTIGDDDG